MHTYTNCCILHNFKETPRHIFCSWRPRGRGPFPLLSLLLTKSSIWFRLVHFLYQQIYLFIYTANCWWESNINVWFQFMYSQKPRNEIAQPHYFQNRIIMFCLPISSERFIYSYDQSYIVGIYKSLTDTWMQKLGTRPRIVISGNICFEFSVQCGDKLNHNSTVSYVQ